MVQSYIQKTNERTDKESSTAAMNMVKQASGVNPLPLLRAFKQPSKLRRLCSTKPYARQHHAYSDIIWEDPISYS